ncbi:hypothetical protein BGZ95_001430 [Linnemannia exigua]|uniref:Peptidase A1 domain-containing protein n=1 Tax=Linnemannia exigua TaxID=604196 RepID=A0AAD4D793_9FUNG|nr:hypothetical protein BGZ95_001430 [Linnemannia exigua]
MHTSILAIALMATLMSTTAALPTGDNATPLARIPLRRNLNYNKDTWGQYMDWQRLMKNFDMWQNNVYVNHDREHHFEYYAQVWVGTPKQAIHLGFDTAGSDVWFGTKNCITGACTNTPLNRRLFSHTASKSFKLNGAPWQISYSGPWKAHPERHHLNASGFVGSDIITIGTLSVQQDIGMADKMSDGWSDRGVDGRLGLGWGSEAVGLGGPSFVQNVMNSGGASNKTKYIVSVQLPSDRRKLGTDGVISFGGSESHRYIGNLHTIPVSGNHGTFKIENIKFNNETINYSTLAVFRSSHHFLGVQDVIADQIHSRIQGAAKHPSTGEWLVPCDYSKNSSGTDGRLALQLNGKDFFIPSWELVLENEFRYEVDKTRLCSSGVQGGFDVWSVGAAFMKNHYLVFEYGNNPSVHIAPTK